MIGSLAGLRQVSIELWIELEVGIPKRDVSESAESRKSVVGIALSWAASIGTSAKDFFRVSNQVPRDGKDCAVAAMEVELRYSTLVVYESRVAAFWPRVGIKSRGRQTKLSDSHQTTAKYVLIYGENNQFSTI